MKLYIVSYALQKNKNYTGLFEQLKASPAWWHYLDSTWLIATYLSANELCERLTPHLAQGDRILIIKAGAEGAALLPEDAVEWIRRILPKLSE
jgi:hypothetical protein